MWEVHQFLTGCSLWVRVGVYATRTEAERAAGNSWLYRVVRGR